MKARMRIVMLWLVFGSAVIVRAERVACVGDSITYGSGIADRAKDSYPAQLERVLRSYDLTWQVRNFGVSGATLLRHGDRPYILESAYADARAYDPDIVIIKLGTNDSKPQNWAHKDEFVGDYSTMIDAFRVLPSKPQVWICKPVPAFRVNFNIRPDVIRDEILPLIEQISRQKDVPVIDLYTALLDKGNLFPDAIHPNAEGAGVMVQTIAPLLLGVRFLPDFNHDGVLNFLDFGRLAASWRQPKPSLDVAPVPSGDGIIGYADLAGLARYWMTSSGLVAHWKLDEAEGALAVDALDRFDGTVHGTPTWRSSGGRIGGALELDGVDDYVSTGHVLNPADGPFTVFIWVKGGLPGQAILAQADEFVRGELWLGTDAVSGAPMTNLTDGARNTSALVADTTITDGNWHRVRLVWDGSFRYLYVDGGPVAADTHKLGNLKFSRMGLRIGAGREADLGNFWFGLIDDIRVYNRALRP